MSDAIQDFGLLRGTQEEIVLLLSENPQIKGPPFIGVIKDDIKDIQTEIQKAVGPLGSGGGCVIVSCPKPAARDAKKPFMFVVTIQIQCLETPIVNRGQSGNQVRSMRMGEIVFNLLEGWNSSFGWCPLQMTSWTSGETEEGYVGDIIEFRTETFYQVQTQP